MRLTALGIAAIAALTLATPAFAQDNAAFTGVRVEAAAGIADVDQFNTDNLIYSATLGVDAPLGSNWTVGAETSVTNVFDDAREFGVAGRLGYAISPNTLVFARAGYTRFDDARNLDTEGLALGAGFEHRLGANTFVTTQYRYTDFDQGDGVHGALIGLGYRF